VLSTSVAAKDKTTPVCRLCGVSKWFGDLKALSDLDMDIREGEFLAIVGENGAGKSTAMSVLFGLLEPDTGHVEIGGVPRKLKSARDALDAGFGMVHQHFKLYPELSVLENILVGDEQANSFGFVPYKQRGAAVSQLIKEFNFSLNIHDSVSDLPVDARQQLEIVKMLYRGAEVLILDEPTAVLTPQESLALYAMLRRLCEQGKSIVLITHKLNEVMDNADRVLVMRQGQLVGEKWVAQTNTGELAKLMVGRHIEKVTKVNHATNEVVLSARSLTVQAGTQKPVLDHVSIDLCAGEIFGVAGVTGNGQKALINTLIGLTPISDGIIEFEGHDISELDVAQRRNRGIGYMAEDRMSLGLASKGAIFENTLAGREASNTFSYSGFLKRKNIRQYARDLITQFDIRTPNETQPVVRLSGGNQQKVIVARELSASPKLLVVENPCWGVDVGAISFIQQQILNLSSKGVAILLISNDLDELFQLSDRVGVMFDGQLKKVFERDELDALAVGVAMSGGE